MTAPSMNDLLNEANARVKELEAKLADEIKLRLSFQYEVERLRGMLEPVDCEHDLDKQVGKLPATARDLHVLKRVQQQRLLESKQNG